MVKVQDIEDRITWLQKWSRVELSAEWEKLFKIPTPRRVSRNLMARAIAYRWQEQAFGGLSASDQKLLDRMAATFMKAPSTLDASIQIKSGTRLRRIWRGKLYEVTVTDNGFVYEGIKCNTLSQIARNYRDEMERPGIFRIEKE